MLVPGNQNADVHSEIWYPWIRKQLEDLGLKPIAKNMPDADLARKEYWLPFIEEQLAGDEDSILIGHSSGTVAALRYAENHKLQGIILISAYHTDLGDEHEKASHYFDEPWQWDKIKQNVKWIIQFHSLNDPYIPIEEARYVAEKLNTEYHEYQDQGHFSSDVGKNEFPELLDALKKMLDKNNSD
ncbi:MAG: alpha/beta hydrolase [Candidatus Aenigmarchaeota archaeon]|nr:alpha/beta hydrolase [Candidatus Aenigmarchaeota archaeon]